MFDAVVACNETTNDGLVHTGRRRIAVVGSGIAGLSAAWLLSKRHDVTIYEAGPVPGGHARTIDLPARFCPEPVSGPVAIDAGFMVFNNRTYPNLVALFRHLGVDTEPSDMSFGVSMEAGRIEYAGSPDPRRLFAQPRNLARPAFLRMLTGLRRFYRTLGALDFDDSRIARSLSQQTLGDYLASEGYPQSFVDWHILPMAGAIWSGSARSILAFPTLTFARFFRNHGLLDFGSRPKWQTVADRSRRYVQAILSDFEGTVRCNAPVDRITRERSTVLVKTKGAPAERYDDIVLAIHADIALDLLSDASADERAILGAFPFQMNDTYIHADDRLMPRRRNVWSSWNVVEGTGRENPGSIAVTYWINRLQNLQTKREIFVSLNPHRAPREDLIIDRLAFRHPQFDCAAIEAQRQMTRIQGNRGTWFAGAWTGYGFHEDGLVSGIRVAAGLGAPAPWLPAPAAAAVGRRPVPASQ